MRLGWALFFFAAIIVVTALICLRWADEIKASWSKWALPFLRSAWGKVAGAVPTVSKSVRVGAAPAAAPAAPNYTQSDITREYTQSGINTAGVLAFLWKARWPILIVSLLVVGVGTMRGCTPPFMKSRDTLAAENKTLEQTNTVLAHETDMANKARELSENTHTDRARVARVIAQAEQEISNAVEAADFDRLYDAYVIGTRSVWNDLQRADRPDPSPSRVAPVRRPGADAA